MNERAPKPEEKKTSVPQIKQTRSLEEQNAEEPKNATEAALKAIKKELDQHVKESWDDKAKKEFEELGIDIGPESGEKK